MHSSLLFPMDILPFSNIMQKQCPINSMLSLCSTGQIFWAPLILMNKLTSLQEMDCPPWSPLHPWQIGMDCTSTLFSSYRVPFSSKWEKCPPEVHQPELIPPSLSLCTQEKYHYHCSAPNNQNPHCWQPLLYTLSQTKVLFQKKNKISHIKNNWITLITFLLNIYADHIFVSKYKNQN